LQTAQGRIQEKSKLYIDFNDIRVCGFVLIEAPARRFHFDFLLLFGVFPKKLREPAPPTKRPTVGIGRCGVSSPLWRKIK
jgi:hypothetical protein